MGKSSGGIRNARKNTRKKLTSEQSKEFHNAAALGLFNSAAEKSKGDENSSNILTVSDLEKSIDINKEREADKLKYNTFEDMNDEQIREALLYSKVISLIRQASKEDSYFIQGNTLGGRQLTTYVYHINNESVMNMLRQVYKRTKNNFVKSVVASVGQNKKFTEKQINIIADEIIKLKDLNVKF